MGEDNMCANNNASRRRRKIEQPSQTNKLFAMYLAMAVRNAMEDFHVKHLSNSQMKELNPIIRNAICTALHAYDEYEKSPVARQFLDFTLRMIPEYWEKPALTKSYREALKRFAE